MRPKDWRRRQKHLHRGKEKASRYNRYVCGCSWCYFGGHGAVVRKTMIWNKHKGRRWDDVPASL